MTNMSANAGRATISAVVSLCVAGILSSLAAAESPERNGLTVHNKGIGGQNTEQGKARFEKDVVALKPDYVFIYFGLNDTLNEPRFVTLEKFVANLEWMLARARAAGIKPVFCTIHRVIEEPLLKRHKRESYGSEGPNSKITRYNAAIRKLAAEKKVPLADFAEAVAAAYRSNPNANIIRPDGVHLGSDGNRLLAKCFLDAVGAQLTGKETIVCLGDSVTYGSGSKTAGTAEGDTYPAFLRCAKIVAGSGDRSPGADRWKAGVAKAVITPKKSIWLAGYGSKRAPEGKLHDLWMKALALQDAAGHRAVLVTSDFQGIPKAMADRTRGKLRQRFGLARDQVMLTFSHNHCGPRLTNDLHDYYPVEAEQEALLDEYTAQMEAKIVEIVGAALKNLAPASLRIGEGRATFAVNRRNNREAEVADLITKGTPLKGPVDHAVPVMTITAADGRLLAVLFGYACHPTTLSFTQWCGDYPGFAQLALEKNHPGTTAMFFNACGGDQNPLPRRHVELCERYGQMLAEGVENALKQPLKPVSPGLRTAFEFVDLAYDKVVTREELQAELQNKNAIRARWAARMLKKLDTGEKFAASYPYPVHAWRLGGELLFIGMGGETVVDYALRFKKEFGPGTWVCGYADDLIAYIPSRRVWEEGGYEGGSFLYEYGRPAFRWAGDVEERIVGTVRRLVQQTTVGSLQRSGSTSKKTTLCVKPYTLPAADLGPENPLPMFRGDNEDDVPKLDPAIPEEERRYLGWRTAWRCLPHRMQDGYNRDKKPRTFDSLVLENECLRATFLPQFGGRLVSLIQKPGGRELLSRNPVFQPANLALRNAWFCGGIEWNTTLRGHHFLTCSPLFAAEVRGTEGEPVLRLYEWDRVRCFPWQIDFHLPPGSPFLFARMRIVNPHDRELPMYWWTTIAVPERKNVRTLAPAATALSFNRDTGVTLVPLPIWNGRDQTYTTQSPSAYDFFSRFAADQRRWIAALDGEGRGLFEVSTDRLRGRKLWGWGMGQGGRRWQEFLSLPGEAYIEIQAGLAQTQSESIPMPARETWCWTEAFGPIETDGKRIHGNDWQRAWQTADEAIEKILPRARMEQLDAKFAAVTTRAPERSLKLGSGWAALERRRCAAQGLPDPIPAELTFPTASLGADQAPWLRLLEKNELPKRDARKEPGALMTQPDWQSVLEKARSNHWLTWWHLGNLRMEALDLDGAEKAWQVSLKCQPTGWTLRNLAVVAERRREKAKACELMRQAWRAGPQVAPLAVECLQTLTRAERYAEAYDFVATLPKAVRSHERVLLLWAKAAIEIGKLEGVERIFNYDFATIREGEVSLTDMWFAFQEKRLAAAEKIPVDDKLRARVRRDFPPPRLIDFRMYVAPGK